MEYFSIVKDSDIFDNPLPEPEEYISRPTVRAIITDEDAKVCVYSINGRTQFPGGGVEVGETPEEACKREAMEEAGVAITMIRPLGKAIEYRAKLSKCYEITFFSAIIQGQKGTPTTTDEEEKKVVIEWLSKEEVKARLQSQIVNLSVYDPESMYVPHFSFRTALSAFERYLKMKE